MPPTGRLLLVKPKGSIPPPHSRYQALLDRYPQSEPLGTRTPDIVPWTIIPNVPPVTGECAHTEEAFCGVLVTVSLDADTAADFLTTAGEFANDRVWGTLSCTLLVDTQTQQQYQPELDAAIASLKYGAIEVNYLVGDDFLFRFDDLGGLSREYLG